VHVHVHVRVVDGALEVKSVTDYRGQCG